MNNKTSVPRGLLATLCCVGALAGCAATPANPDDPLEGYNRAMFSFNEGLDKAVIKPAAEGYRAVLPTPVRTGVSNFFGNIGDVWIGCNNILQGKLEDGVSDFTRVVMNSTFGVLGLFDVASALGVEKHDEDFGQTLAVWGVGDGPFVVLPFFGGRTTRDAVALPADYAAEGAIALSDPGARNATTVVHVVNTRANNLGIERTLEEGTLDKYAYARDFYLQQRRYKVYDGHPPRENFDE